MTGYFFSVSLLVPPFLSNHFNVLDPPFFLCLHSLDGLIQSHGLLLSFILHTKSIRKSCHLYFKINTQFGHLPCYHPDPSHMIFGLNYYHSLISFLEFTLPSPFYSLFSTQQSELFF